MTKNLRSVQFLQVSWLKDKRLFPNDINENEVKKDGKCLRMIKNLVKLTFVLLVFAFLLFVGLVIYLHLDAGHILIPIYMKFWYQLKFIYITECFDCKIFDYFVYYALPTVGSIIGCLSIVVIMVKLIQNHFKKTKILSNEDSF